MGVFVGLFNLVRWILRSLRITRGEKAAAKDVAPALLVPRPAPDGLDAGIDVHGPVFVSYSRTESLLVDELVRRLEADGHPVFVDYRALQPGEAWSDQLDAALTTSPVLVVVVSDRSVWGSENVQREWMDALARGQRIVLAVAEPVPLPPALAGRPWVDLRRGRFSRRLREVAALVGQERAEIAAGRLPGPPGPLPPTAPGFRLPRALWLAFLLSVPLALGSLVLFWLVFPLLVVPLPMRILQRRVVLAPVVTMCAVGGAFGVLAAAQAGQPWLLLVPAYFLAVVLSLRRRACRRWLAPMDIRVPPPAGRADTLPEVTPGPFWIDAASQDLPYAHEVAAELEAAGHRCVGWTGPAAPPGTGPGEGARVLRFVSRFNDRAEIVPGTRTLPLLLSNPDDPFPPALQATQWLDLRSGWPRRGSPELATLARCLDAPRELVRRLGTVPSYDAFVLPRAVRLLHDGLIVAVMALVLAAIAAADDGLAAIASLAAVAIGLVTIVVLRRRTPTPLFVALLPAMVLLAVVTAVTTSVSWELAAFAAAVVAVLGLVTRRPVALWVPRRREPAAQRSTGPEPVAAAVHAFAGAARAAFFDATGRTLRQDRRRRRHRPGLRRRGGPAAAPAAEGSALTGR